MKTKLLTLATIAVIALNVSGAVAETCEGGRLVTGENGHVYCQSNNNMNWWSAYTWCEAQGRHLASMYEICSTWDGSTGNGKNCNISLSGWLWSATAKNNDSAFCITATTVSDYGRNSSHVRALCY